jgi:hypothetical protein
MAQRSSRGVLRGAERILIELVRPSGPRGLERATADDLRETAALAYGHGLFLLVDHRIREHEKELPAAAAAAYHQAARPLRLRHIVHAHRSESAERDALSLLETAAVPSVVIKGSAFSRDLHGGPHLRSSADIDVLVRPGDVPAVDAALTAAGFRRDNDRPLPFWMRRLHHAVYRHPASRLPLEIHWAFSIPGFFAIDAEEIWAGVVLDGLRGRLDPATLLILLLMHHHLHGCCDLRTLVDLAWGLERYRPQLDDGFLADRLASSGLLVVAGIARLQAEKLWGPPFWDPGGRSPTQQLRASLLASAAGLALRPGRAARPNDRFLHAAVHRLGLDSARRVFASIAKTLLPAAADVRALTGSGRSGLAGYVRYFTWRFGERSAARAMQGRGSQE